MTDWGKSNRLPFYLALAGVFLLTAVGVYMYQTHATVPAGVASVADKDAEAAIAAAGMSNDDRKATEAVVRAYILEHPEIITEAVAILQSREMEARLDSVGDALFAPFAGDVAGNPDGDITVVEFTDYNCGFCRASVPDVQRLLNSDSNIRLVYRELPILSQSSRDAGTASDSLQRRS